MLNQKVLIKRYLNGRLYDTSKQAYVTMTDLLGYIVNGIQFEVYSNVTKDFITKDINAGCVARMYAQKYNKELIINFIKNN
jgi:polyhydroxyalkanoate synthesis regulator protein